MNKEELVEFYRDLVSLERRWNSMKESVHFRVDMPPVRVVIPKAWSLNQEGVVREVFQVETIRADVEKPGVLV